MASNGFGRMDRLALFTLIDDGAARANGVEIVLLNDKVGEPPHTPTCWNPTASLQWSIRQM